MYPKWLFVDVIFSQMMFDVLHGNRNSGGVSLKQDARVHSADYFIRNGTTGRENTFTRSPGFTPAALRYSNMYDDVTEQLAELQKTLFMVKVNAEMEMLQQEDMLTTHHLYHSGDVNERLLYSQKVCIGKAAMNVHYEIDPLHIFINARKDAAVWWNDVLLGPLFQLISGSKYKDTMSMAEIEALEDVLLAAWLNVRKYMLPALKAVAHSRFDISAFIWHMEVSLSIPVILYDFLLRQEGAGEAYYEVLLFALLETILRQRHNYPAALCRKIAAVLYLKLKNHDQARVLLKGCHVIDAAFGEHGINALLRNILQGVTSADEARTHAKLHFAKRSSAAGRGIVHDFGSNGKVKYVLGRSMDVAVTKAQNLIGSIVESLIGAENADKLPRRVNFNGSKKFKSDAYQTPALFPDLVLAMLPEDRRLKAHKRKFPSHEVGAPAFALNARSFENRGISPDEKNGCHVKDCTAGADDQLQYLICGHSRCQPCFARSQQCSDCVERAAKRIEHVAMTEAATERDRFITAVELRETSLSEEQDQLDADEAQSSVPAADAGPPLNADGVADEFVGMIQSSIEANRARIVSALEQNVAGRRERAAAVAAGGIANAGVVLPVAFVAAVAPPVALAGDNEPVRGNVHHKRGHKRGRVQEAVIIPLVCPAPAEQPVPLALCGFPKQSKQGRAALCTLSAANCGYNNHKLWRDEKEKESAPVLSEPSISDEIAPPAPVRLNTHIIFPE